LACARHAHARLRTQRRLFFARRTDIRTRTNHSGGIQGGISNGEDIIIRAAFKPVATILREQQTVDSHGNFTVLMPRGRHNRCVLPAPPIVEAMMALVLADHYLRQRGLVG
jgi:chorismate synthase